MNMYAARRALAVICCLAMICTLAPAGAAEMPEPGANGLISAVGAPDPNAVVLRTAGDFSNIREGGSYVLAGDVDFSGFNTALLGQLDLVNATLDGQGHRIVNLSLSGDAQGLFRRVSGSQVKNLIIESPRVGVQTNGAGVLAGEIRGGSVVSNCAVLDAQFSNLIRGSGLLAYELNGSTVEDCAASGSMMVSAPAGGLVAVMSGDSRVSGCVSDVDISASGYSPAGGLIGWCSSGTQTVSQCLAEGPVALTVSSRSSGNNFGPYAGGLIGQVDSAVTVSDCMASGAVSGVSSSADVYAGGLFGLLSGSGTVSGCAAVGAVSTDNSGESGLSTSSSAGGLIARCMANKDGIALSRCYAGGNVSALAGSYTYAGGLIGNLTFSGKYSFALESCSADSLVELTEPGWTWKGAAGGLLGGMSYNRLDNGDANVTVSGACYYVSGDAVGQMERVQFISNGTLTRVTSVPAQGVFMPGGPSDWALEEVALARAAGLIPAGLDGRYQRSITRAEFCALGVNLLTALNSPLASASGGQSFNDTNDKNVLIMSAAGIVTGHGDGRFGPDDSITRQEAAVMLGRLSHAVGISQPNGATLQYADLAQAADWAREDIQFLSGCMDGAQRVMGGVGSGLFDPYGTYTREQAVLSMLRLYHFLGGSGSLPTVPEPSDPIPSEPEAASPFVLDGSFYTYNGQPLKANRRYDLTAGLRLEKGDELELPAGATVNVAGDVEITGGRLTLASDAKLACDGRFAVDGDGIIDLSSGGSIAAGDFFFDSDVNHLPYLTDGVISAKGDVEIRQNFYATGSNEFQIIGGYRHEINMWNKIVREDQYFNIFHIVGNGFEVLDVKEPFATAESGFVADDWSWLTMDYGGDLLFSGAPQPSDELKGALQAGVMLAIAREGDLRDAQVGGMKYLDVDAEDFTFSYFDPKAEEIRQLTIDVEVFGLQMTGGTAVTGTVRYGGRQYVFNTDPAAADTLWQAFQNSTTIGIIEDLVSESGEDYWNVAKSLLAEMMPDWSNALEMTDFLMEMKDVTELLSSEE